MEILIPVTAERLKQQRSSLSDRSTSTQIPLISQLGIVQGEILSCIERKGSATLDRLMKDLVWPRHILVMAVGALIYQGLVRGFQSGHSVVLKVVT